MLNRLARIGRWRPVGRLIPVALAAALLTGLQAEDLKTVPPVATKTIAADNVMWRFDGNGRFPNVRPPSEWRMERNILWKTPVEIGGYSSPIVVKNKVFVTAEMGSLICLDVANGKILWKKDLFSPTSTDIPPDLTKKLMRGCGGDSKQSTPTPTSNGELVFYINAMGLCACYDLQGHRKWVRIIETAEDEEHFSASPIFIGDRIILSWGCLLALNAKDGTILWKAIDAKPTHGTPAITRIGDVEVAITPAGDIVRLIDGEILCAGLFESTFTTPLIEGNTVYVIDAVAKALELPARAEKGMQLKELWNIERIGEFMASPIYWDGLIYTIESKRGRLHIMDAKTGEVLTVTRSVDPATKAPKIEAGLKIEGLTVGRYAYASPVVAGKNVFFFDDSGNTAVFELGREHKLARINKLEDGLVGTPFFFDDKVIIRGNETVYCIGEKH
ncbi:MAG: outer rane biosis protein BamB [Planctomycetaceae bacterium]|nr:outer rane biosis protein BamB [Planctomycetaceae bacterium]